jgi:hypothetical protein
LAPQGRMHSYDAGTQKSPVAVWVHTTVAPSSVALFPRDPGAQWRSGGGLAGRLGAGAARTVVRGTTVVVGSTNVVVVGGLLGGAIGGADVGATVDGTAVVAVELVAIALDSPFGAPEQAAVPRPNTTSAETVTNLILRMC